MFAKFIEVPVKQLEKLIALTQFANTSVFILAPVAGIDAPLNTLLKLIAEDGNKLAGIAITDDANAVLLKQFKKFIAFVLY